MRQGSHAGPLARGIARGIPWLRMLKARLGPWGRVPAAKDMKSLGELSREGVGRASQVSLKRAMALKMRTACACFQISIIS